MKTHYTGNETQERALVEAGVLVKLGLDVHARQITVCRQIGDRTPQPPQVFTKERLLVWIRKMVEAGAIVHSCYEAGVMGYTLHRELSALGVKNIVIAPQKLSGAKRQKTDALDARALVERLDRWLRGNRDACSIVRVPTPAEEQARAQARLRDHHARMRRRAEARGRCLLVAQGFTAEKYWWRKAKWDVLKPTLPEWLRLLVAEWQETALDFDRRERTLRAQLEAAAPQNFPAASGRSPGSSSRAKSATGPGSTIVVKSRATPACVRASTPAMAAVAKAPSTAAAIGPCAPPWWNWCGGSPAGSRITNRSARSSTKPPSARAAAESTLSPPPGGWRSTCGDSRPIKPQPRRSASTHPAYLDPFYSAGELHRGLTTWAGTARVRQGAWVKPEL